METNLITKILLSVFVLHLVIGFGYMIYKLSPLSTDKKKADVQPEDQDSE